MLKVYLEQIKGDDSGSSVILKKGTTKIGRKDADIVFNSKRISSVHAEIHYSGTRVFVQDRNSTNGTYINDVRVERTALKDGDIVSFGGVGDKASLIYKLHIVREIPKRRVIFVNRPGLKIPNKAFSFLLIIPVLFFLWLLLPIGGDNKNSLSAFKEKPWEINETIIPVSTSSGSELVLALGDSVLLPLGSNWKSEVRYEKADDSDDFENRLYIIDLWNESGTDEYSNELLRATVTLQRFKKDFVGNIQKETENNFIWHETHFTKENNINKKFSYSKTEMAIWQWIIWESESKFNLYATCVTTRGRILLQASAFDIYVIKRFFQYVAGTYIEGASY